ncbi:unnamed protein product [Arabidopsis thaliana]|uniref:Uncharacterized protein n=1 Tax=Arabidopsis thaliana TaxID=3702 RepID=A0A654G7D5_ARATH|nr:unnamed protein product [Arabidopsis thaliana]
MSLQGIHESIDPEVDRSIPPYMSETLKYGPIGPTVYGRFVVAWTNRFTPSSLRFSFSRSFSTRINSKPSNPFTST